MIRFKSSRAKKICDKIKAIEIQGAHRVAKYGIKAFFYELSMYVNDKHTKQEVYERAFNIMEHIKGLRSTEPMLFNYLDDILQDIKQMNVQDNISPDIKSYIKEKHEIIDDRLKNDRDKLADYGAGVVKNGDVILVHCHSTSVMLSLRNAKDAGKKFKVYATETRPLFQGHKTVRDLLSYGIDTTLIIDDAVGMIIDKITKVFVGGDSVSQKGDLANKIGTKVIAELAKSRKINVYSCVELYKMDSREQIVIEQRDPHEVLDRIPHKLKVLNYAFDITPTTHVHRFITEKGVFSSVNYVKYAKKTIKRFYK